MSTHIYTNNSSYIVTILNNDTMKFSFGSLVTHWFVVTRVVCGYLRWKSHLKGYIPENKKKS